MADRKRRVFLAGATGSMGLAATEALTRAGHEVLGVTRSDEGAVALRALGATPVRVDLFDARALTEAMRGADAVVHFATKVPDGTAGMKPGAWKEDDRLRRDGTRSLLQAAEAAGISRFIFESLALAYPHRADEWIDESVALTPHTGFMRSVVEAEAMLEAFGQRGGEPVSLRYGRIYGPGRASAAFIASVRKGQMPIIGRGDNFVSSIHTDDVGTSVVAALDAPPGVYNVADDTPVTQRDLIAAATGALEAPDPRCLPYPLARALMGRLAIVLTASQRVSNRRLHEATGWTPRFASVAQGWPDVARRHAAVTMSASAEAAAAR